MAVSTDSQSRRRILAAGLSGLAAAIVHATWRPASVRAATGDPLVLGVPNRATTTTLLENTGSGHAFHAQTSGSEYEDQQAISVFGQTSSGTGIYGESSTGRGVTGTSGTFYGVYGTNQGPAAAVLGHSQADGPGVHGFSGGNALPGDPPPRTGVYGYAGQNGTARGVFGKSSTGRGVHGHSGSGVGVLASTLSGVALVARGAVKFSTAGLATIPAGTDRVLVTPGVDITAASKLFAVLQSNPGANIALRFVGRDVMNDRFTVQLSGNARVATLVAWFVIS